MADTKTQCAEAYRRHGWRYYGPGVDPDIKGTLFVQCKSINSTAASSKGICSDMAAAGSKEARGLVK